jgi:hypothetical protein
MSSQRGHSLDNLLGETNDLKERMRQVLPSYVGLLKEVSSLPDEFERRFWVSRVEALLQTVKTDYESFQAKAQQVDFLGKFMMVGIDLVLKTGGMQPVAPPPSPQLGVTVSSSGKIEPDWRDNPYREPKGIFVTYDEFMAIVQRLKDKLLKGTIVPTREEEIPKLLHSLALELPKNSPDD